MGGEAGGAGGCSPTSFCQIFAKSSFFASTCSISMPTAPSRSSQSPHFQIHSAVYVKPSVSFIFAYTPLLGSVQTSSFSCQNRNQSLSHNGLDPLSSDEHSVRPCVVIISNRIFISRSEPQVARGIHWQPLAASGGHLATSSQVTRSQL